MSRLAPSLSNALAQWRRREVELDAIASWAGDQVELYLEDAAHRYSFLEDISLEALGLVAEAPDAPEPDVELDEAQALLTGDRPFSAARLLLVDPAWVAQTPAAQAAELAGDAGARVERGADGKGVAQLVGPALDRAVDGLAGADYVELLCIEAAALCDELRLAVKGEVEVLGRGRPRIDASILAERLASVGQVLRGERPLRALVRGRGADAVQVVLSY